MLKTTNERIENIKTKIEQLENERKRLLGLQKVADRKARTKRLIERGAILESLITDSTSFTNDQIKHYLEKIITPETIQKFLTGTIKQKNESAPTDSQWKAKAADLTANDKSAQMTMGSD